MRFIKQFNFKLLKQGFNLKRKIWSGFWRWKNNTIMMYCKNGEIIDIRNTKDVDFTISNMYKNDWEIATEDNSIVLKNIKKKEEI